MICVHFFVFGLNRKLPLLRKIGVLLWKVADVVKLIMILVNDDDKSKTNTKLMNF